MKNLSSSRVAILCCKDSCQRMSRAELISYLRSLGCKLFVFGYFSQYINEYYSENTATFAPIVASRNNTNPLLEIKSVFSVAKQIKKNKIDFAIIYGIKNHCAMAIGARLGGAGKVMCIVNGRGNLFRFSGIKGTFLRLMAFPCLRIAYGISKSVCFQNPDDMQYFLKKKLIFNKTDAFVSNGSGVNLDYFHYTTLPNENIFLYLSRITPTKGIKEFVLSARIVKSKYSDAVFEVVGPIDTVVEHGDFSELNSAVDDGIVSYFGEISDVAPYLSGCRYFIYPSYYPEGVPRCALEAIASGRPIITCDVPGCKETVIDGVNGFKIQPGDYVTLAEKMIWMIEHPEKVEQMALESRKYAEEKFDVNKINKMIVDKLTE